MKPFLPLIAAVVALTSATPLPKLTPRNIKQVVAAMTLEEKARLVVGASSSSAVDDSQRAAIGRTDLIVPGAAGTTYPIDRLGIPAIVFADGPAGLRISPRRDGTTDTFYCTGFPVGTMLASTWNTALIESVGRAMGNEVREYGVDVILGPGMNIHRNPLCGRNFEYYSEDPVLAGLSGAAMVRGVQSNGVGTSIKHFAANNQEINRLADDARVSVRALREIYLRQFEITVRESAPWTIMSSYNYLNGQYTSERHDLLTDVLRGDWGYKGLVVTDWGGGIHTPLQISAGNDLIEPGGIREYNEIVNAVKEGSLKESELDLCVERVLQLIVQTPHFKGFKCSNKPDLKAHAQTALEGAEEGIVLLENRNAVLPLAKGSNVALFGVTSYDFIAGGTGSGEVNKAYVVNLREGVQNAGLKLDTEVDKAYKEYIATEHKRLYPINSARDWFYGDIAADEMPSHADLAEKAAEHSDVAIFTIGRNSGEGTDRWVRNDFNLKESEEKALSEICTAFHKAGKPVVVILNVGGVVETASWKNIPDAILLAWQGGQEGGNAVANVLTGVINPSGHLPATFPLRYADVPSQNFPALELNTGSNDSFYRFFGSKKVYEVPNVDYTNYTEDIYVGYRYYTTRRVEVSYPFGYGLSYTTFAISAPKVRKNADGWTVTVRVTNTGKHAGKQVVQLYSTAPHGKLDKPVRELQGFAKTPLLLSGKSAMVSIHVSAPDLASFDESRSAWVTDSGEYVLSVATDANTVSSEVRVQVAHDIVRKVHDVLHPTDGSLFIN